MDLITALALSIGVLGGIATFLFLSPFGMGLQIWAAFLGWASFFHCGGKEKGFLDSVIANIWGAVMAGLTLIAVSGTGLADSFGLPIWAGICVAIGVAIMILGAKIPLLSAIPAAVYGYAATVALALLSQNGLENLTVPTLGNPVLNVAASMAIGGVFGYVSQKVAGALSSG